MIGDSRDTGQAFSPDKSTAGAADRVGALLASRIREGKLGALSVAAADAVTFEDWRTSGRAMNAEARLIAGEPMAAARTLIAMMKPRDREILTRFYIHEQSVEHICAEMDFDGAVFRNVKTRAKARLTVMARRLRMAA